MGKFQKIAFIVCLPLAIGHSIAGRENGDPAVSPAQAATVNPLSNIHIGSLRGGTTGFGTVLELNFTISNQNKFAIKDVNVHCAIFGASGTILSFVNKTIYQRVQPGGTIALFDQNMGFVNPQVDRFACSATAFQMSA